MKTKRTPWPVDTKVPAQWEALPDIIPEYLKQMGSLNYLATNTRPDIVLAVNKLAKGNSGPGEAHLKVLKHLWRYLQETRDLGIIVGGVGPQARQLTTYADAAFADDLHHRYSTGVAMLSCWETAPFFGSPASKHW